MRSQMLFWRVRRQRESTAIDRLGEPGYGHSALRPALVLRDGGLAFTKMDTMVDPLRNEPRFKAVLAALKFPD
jgi:hypothetical protein